MREGWTPIITGLLQWSRNELTEELRSSVVEEKEGEEWMGVVTDIWVTLPLMRSLTGAM